MNDLRWPRAVDLVRRLQTKASTLGRGFGVKFTNTLVVDSTAANLPSGDGAVYLSGAPLHVLAMHLVRDFRREFGAAIPVSFSGGIDRHNFADAVSLGLTPVTVCTDLLKPGGYARQQSYLADLEQRMAAVGATRLDEYLLRARGLADRAAGDLGAATALNTEDYVADLANDRRYAHAANSRTPKKVGSQLELFDCLTCDKCLPVCPNHANFSFVLPRTELVRIEVSRIDGQWAQRPLGNISIAERHQIGTLADFCNECGNCDVFCPEDGGPYLEKPRFFATREQWQHHADHDGFYLARCATHDEVLARFGGLQFAANFRAGLVGFRGPGFDLEFAAADPVGTLSGTAEGPVDLGYFAVMDLLRTALFDEASVNYLNA